MPISFGRICNYWSFTCSKFNIVASLSSISVEFSSMFRTRVCSASSTLIVPSQQTTYVTQREQFKATSLLGNTSSPPSSSVLPSFERHQSSNWALQSTSQNVITKTFLARTFAPANGRVIKVSIIFEFTLCFDNLSKC